MTVGTPVTAVVEGVDIVVPVTIEAAALPRPEEVKGALFTGGGGRGRGGGGCATMARTSVGGEMTMAEGGRPEAECS